ncbi:MAG: hypothetical protein VX574_07970 [Myxococcota bacterium]|nr:hypothetical protein [Myxococcota bacterium]
MPRPMERRRPHAYQWEVWAALAAYLALLTVSTFAGYQLTVPWDYFQLLPQRALIGNLGESLYYLHAQPPLMNLELGLGLKLARALDMHWRPVLFGIHIALGGIAVYAFTRLCQSLMARGWIRAVAIAVFVLSPVFYMSLFQFFYTFHEVVLLSLLALAVFSYAKTRSTFDYGCVCIVVALLVGTHSLFHFAWGLIVLVSLPWVCRKAAPRTPASPPTYPAGQLAWLAASFVVLLAWPVKNGLLFDSFHASSWGGYSMALELPVDVDRLPPRDWSVPDRFASVPVVADRLKSDGSANWNHFSIIQHSRNQGELALQALAEDPLALARKARLNYWNFTRFAGRNPYTGSFGISDHTFPGALAPWMKTYETVVFQDPRTRDTVAHRAYRNPMRQSWEMSGFAFLFPLVLLGSAVAILRSRSTDPEESSTALFLLFCVLWVLVTTLLIDGSEANRLRFSTEPYFFILAFWSLDRLLRNTPSGAPGREAA